MRHLIESEAAPGVEAINLRTLIMEYGRREHSRMPLRALNGPPDSREEEPGSADPGAPIQRGEVRESREGVSAQGRGFCDERGRARRPALARAHRPEEGRRAA